MLLKAFSIAREQRHTEVTVEYLLVTILDDPSVTAILDLMRVNIDQLRSGLLAHISGSASIQCGTDEVNSQPTLGFQRVIQQAIMGVQSNCPKGTEVTGAHVLMFVYHEKGHAVESLHKEGLTRADVKTFADKKAEVPGSYTDSRRPSLLEALQLKGGTMEEAYASLEQKGYFTPPPRPWRLGFQDRGMGRRDYAVLDKFGDPVVQAPNRIVAEFIIKAVNNYQE